MFNDQSQLDISAQISLFRDAIVESGMIPPKSIIPDGSIHRFSEGKKKSKKDGWYVLYPSGLGGAFGNHKGIHEKWSNRESREALSPYHQAQISAYIEDAKETARIAKLAEYGIAAQEASRILEAVEQSDFMFESQYLKAKGFHEDLCELALILGSQFANDDKGDHLLVPMIDEHGFLWNLQRIYESGKKRYLNGSRTSNLYHMIGHPTEDEAILYIGEGFATMASIHKATDRPCVVAFSWSNLKAVTKIIKEKYPHSKIIICGDDDIWLDPSNVGRTAAEEAAELSLCEVIFPRFQCLDTKPTDFNDLHCLEGIDAVLAQLEGRSIDEEVKIEESPIEEIILAVEEIGKKSPPRIIAQEDPIPDLPIVTEPLLESPEPIFPISALGSLIPYVTAIQDLTQTPVEIAAQSVLSVAAVSVQALADCFHPMRNVAFPSSIFFMTIAESSDRKSSADSDASLGMDEMEIMWEEEYKQEMKVYEFALSVWEKQKSDILKKSNMGGKNDTFETLSAMEDKPEQPLSYFIKASEPTTEGLFKGLNGSKGSMGIFSAEGGQLLGGHAMTSENKLKFAGFLSSLWDGASHHRSRAALGESSILRGKRLSAHLLVQPLAVQATLNDPLLVGQGFWARWLIASPKSLAGTRFAQEPKKESLILRDQWRAKVRSILQFPRAIVKGSRNVLKPREIPLSKEAVILWKEAYNGIENKMRENEVYESFRSIAGKFMEHSQRLATVVAVTENIGITELSAKELQAGIDLAQYYLDVYIRLVDKTKISQDEKDAEKILDFIRKKSSPIITVRDIQMGCRVAKDGHKARKLLSILVDQGYIAHGGKRNSYIMARGD